MKILIADDSLMDRKLSMNLLKKAGIENEVLQAVDGEEALKIVGENANDIGVILLDWQMPNLDGIGFMKAIVNVEATKSIPIIMITASGSDENKNLAYEVNPGLAGYLVKPYNTLKLTELVKQLLNSEQL